MKTKRKIVGLSCGRKNGNCEILLKEALMAAEEFGIESEIIRAMELRVKHCTGCESCSIAMSKGLEPKCVIKDDDVEWILEKTIVEDCAMILSVPVYHLRANGLFMCIHERMLPIMFRHPEILRKNNVGGIISVGGGNWTTLALPTMNIFFQHTRLLVDQMQVQYVSRPGAVLAIPEIIARARLLGKRVAKAMLMPIEKVKYMGEDSEASCPVCHCTVLHVPGRLSKVECPVCGIHGTIYGTDSKPKIKWNKEDIKNPRFSQKSVLAHEKDIGENIMKFINEDYNRVKGLMKKYASYGNLIKPEEV